jgi:hypothetical protein
MNGIDCAHVMPISFSESGTHQIVWSLKIFLYTGKAGENGKRVQQEVDGHNYKFYVKRLAWHT